MAKASKSADTKKRTSTPSKKAKAAEDIQEVSPNLIESDDGADEKPEEKTSKEVKSSDIIYKKPVRLHL